MTPGPLALSVYRGDTARYRFVLWADATKATPVDLTGVAAHAEVRRDFGTPVLATLPCVVTLPQTIDTTITAAISAALPAAAVWDLQLTYASGDVVTVLAGPVLVRSDVTAGVGA